MKEKSIKIFVLKNPIQLFLFLCKIRFIGKGLNMFIKIKEFTQNNLSKCIVILWTIISAFMSNSYLCDYYQRCANSHYEGTQLIQMGSIMIVAFIFAAIEFKKKNIFVGLLLTIIAIWAFYFMRMPSFECVHCANGG